MKTRPPPLRVVVAAGPESPGVSDLLARAGAEARAGADVSVLFTGSALTTSWDSLPRDGAGPRLLACSRAARDLGVAVPAGFLPSSLVAFLREGPPGARLWSAFP
jgi:hypothetical protein